MSTNRVNLSNAVRFILVNLLFLLISVIIISECLGTGLAAKAEELSSISENTVATEATAAQAVVRPKNVSGFKVSSADAANVNLKWSEVSGAEGYIVYQYNNTKKTWLRISKTTGSDNVSYNVKGLASGTNYKFAVKAYVTDNNGKELSSAEYPTVSAVTNLYNVSGFKSATASSSRG